MRARARECASKRASDFLCLKKEKGIKIKVICSEGVRVLIITVCREEEILEVVCIREW